MRRLYKTGFNTQSPQSLFHLKTLYCSKVICAQKYASFQFLIITCVLLLQLVTATGLWLNISTHRGLLTVIKTNKPLSSLTLEFEHEAHTGAVTPNLNTREEERQRREGQTRGGERALLPTFLPKRPLPPSTCCYHWGCSKTHIKPPPPSSSCLFYHQHTDTMFGVTTKQHTGKEKHRLNSIEKTVDLTELIYIKI